MLKNCRFGTEGHPLQTQIQINQDKDIYTKTNTDLLKSNLPERSQDTKCKTTMWSKYVCHCTGLKTKSHCQNRDRQHFGDIQGGRSWRASGDRQISLNASAERAFANFRDKKHRILQLQIFATKTSFYNCKRLQPCARVASPALTLVPLR